MVVRTRVTISFGYGVLVLVATKDYLYVMWLCSFSVASYNSRRCFMFILVANYLSAVSAVLSSL